VQDESAEDGIAKALRRLLSLWSLSCLKSKKNNKEDEVC
jgi:hypothetical protein